MDGGTISTVAVAAIGAVGVAIGASIGLIAARKTAQITADNQARMQLEKLGHDTFVGEIAFKRAKLEELYEAVARATAYSSLSVAVFRHEVAPTPEQQLELFNENMESIYKARTIATLYFDRLTETVDHAISIIDNSLNTQREYFRIAPERRDAFQIWTNQIAELTDELRDLRAELKAKVAKEASQLNPENLNLEYERKGDFP
jgi:hypothetical protein